MISTEGRHLLVELSGCPADILSQEDLLKYHLRAAALEAGAQIVTDVFHTFETPGVSGLVVLRESHISIHTWPLDGYAAVDIYTCGATNPKKAIAYLEHALEAEMVFIRDVKRGIQDASFDKDYISHENETQYRYLPRKRTA